MCKTSLRVRSLDRGQQNSSGIAGDGTRTVRVASPEGAARACRRPRRVRSSIKVSKIRTGRAGTSRREDPDRIRAVGQARLGRAGDHSGSAVQPRSTKLEPGGPSTSPGGRIRIAIRASLYRRGSRVQETTPGSQFDQGEEQNRSRQRANRRDDAGEARRSAQPRSQSLSRQQSRASNNVEQRRYRADDNSGRANRSSPSPNRNSSRPQQFKHSASTTESASGKQTRRNRNSSTQETRKSYQAKSQPSHQESNSARSRSSQGNTSNYNRPKSSQQSARVERSSGQSRRVAPSASRQGQQPANGGGKSRGGGKQGGKKADRDNKDN